MISDEELLAAVRSAGEPGTMSHRLACRAYRRSVIEWRGEYAARPVFGGLVALLAGVLDPPAPQPARRRPVALCGTSAGWKRHRREGTETCKACREYERERTRARRLSARAEERAWQAAA